ncbi:hypothetical protein L7F22_023515 [Adiantum nelumboides]|nr:hypothetical protein [Adiantum nelumboides]
MNGSKNGRVGILSNVGDARTMHAVFELEALMLTSHCHEQNDGPPWGLQLVLGTKLNPHVVETIVMANLGYWQLKAALGHTGSTKDSPHQGSYVKITGLDMTPKQSIDVPDQWAMNGKCSRAQIAEMLEQTGSWTGWAKPNTWIKFGQPYETNNPEDDKVKVLAIMEKDREETSAALNRVALAAQKADEFVVEMVRSFSTELSIVMRQSHKIQENLAAETDMAYVSIGELKRMSEDMNKEMQVAMVVIFEAQAKRIQIKEGLDKEIFILKEYLLLEKEGAAAAGANATGSFRCAYREAADTTKRLKRIILMYTDEIQNGEEMHAGKVQPILYVKLDKASKIFEQGHNQQGPTRANKNSARVMEDQQETWRSKRTTKRPGDQKEDHQEARRPEGPRRPTRDLEVQEDQQEAWRARANKTGVHGGPARDLEAQEDHQVARRPEGLGRPARGLEVQEDQQEAWRARASRIGVANGWVGKIL